MTSTPYKDELIRVALLLGLPDDVDPTTVAGALEARLAELGDAVEDLAVERRRVEAEQTIRQTAERDRNQYRDGLEASAVALERLGSELTVRRERAKSPQAFADMTQMAELAAQDAARARRALVPTL